MRLTQAKKVKLTEKGQRKTKKLLVAEKTFLIGKFLLVSLKFTWRKAFSGGSRKTFSPGEKLCFESSMIK